MDAGSEVEARAAAPHTTPAGKDRLLTVALVAASLVLHAGILYTLLIAPDRTPQPEPRIIPVDIVIEPKTPPQPAAAEPQPSAPEQQATSEAEPSSSSPAAQAGTTDRPTESEPPQSTATPPPIAAPAPFDSLPPSFRAVTLPATAIGGTEAASYKAIVFGLLAAAKRYPDAARTRGATGAAVVAFAVDTSGHLLRANVARPSGDADLDAEALATVRRCNPFPPPPQGAQTAFAAVIEFGNEP